jgi:hypothetical protein
MPRVVPTLAIAPPGGAEYLILEKSIAGFLAVRRTTKDLISKPAWQHVHILDSG